MKDKILFINACVRPKSRTAELSRHLLNRLNGEITEVNLYQEDLLPLHNEGIEKRALHNISGEEFEYAKQFASADTIVIAAPFIISASNDFTSLISPVGTHAAMSRLVLKS